MTDVEMETPWMEGSGRCQIGVYLVRNGRATQLHINTHPIFDMVIAKSCQSFPPLVMDSV